MTTDEVEAVHALDGDELDVLELLLGGVIAPVAEYCLPGGAPAEWPFEATLRIPSTLAATVGRTRKLVLTDPDATPLANLAVTAIVEGSAGAFVAGRLTPDRPAEHPPARNIRITTPRGYEDATLVLFDAVPAPEQTASMLLTAAGRPLVLVAVSWEAASATAAGTVELVNALHSLGSVIPNSRIGYLATPPTATGVDARVVLHTAVSNLGAAEVIDFTSLARPTRRTGRSNSGLVILLTGLSGSGKSTIARALSERLRVDFDRPTVLLDGDDVRRVLSAGLGFSAEDRELNLERIAWVASRIAAVGGIAVCAPIAPFAQSRQGMRAAAEEVGSFRLVYVSTPIEVCEMRDRKGLYAKARSGVITDFTGIDSPYEVPEDADVSIDTSILTVGESVDSIVRLLRETSAI